MLGLGTMSGAFERGALLTCLAGLVDRERAALADQDRAGVRGARERLSLELLVARIADLGDARVTAQLAGRGCATARPAAQIEALHSVLFADQHLSTVDRAGLRILVVTSVSLFRRGGVTQRPASGV